MIRNTRHDCTASPSTASGSSSSDTSRQVLASFDFVLCTFSLALLTFLAGVFDFFFPNIHLIVHCVCLFLSYENIVSWKAYFNQGISNCSNSGSNFLSCRSRDVTSACDSAPVSALCGSGSSGMPQ